MSLRQLQFKGTTRRNYSSITAREDRSSSYTNGIFQSTHDSVIIDFFDSWFLSHGLALFHDSSYVVCVCVQTKFGMPWRM